ncbi:hypothetical protein [uncultured Roseibium sp.]|uniref:hypothetical protein n=1 Tax=uncultured Roseibium sp. TaxID=1936171 RepID=UPI0026052D41|nr:hypothetical protein [uncultured Roseibium sp.]
MQYTATKQFITALASVGSEILGDDHALLSRINSAGPAPDACTVEEIQNAISALPEETCDALMSAVHKHMREDISAIWSHLPNASDDQPN